MAQKAGKTNSQKSAVVIVFSTVDRQKNAQQIATKLVQEGLAACVNIVPQITSIYSWQGKIHQDRECLLIIKTTFGAYKKLEKRLKTLHPYDVPEIVSWETSKVYSPYAQWVIRSLRK